MTVATFLKIYVDKIYSAKEFYGVQFSDTNSDAYMLTEPTPINTDYYEICLLTPCDAVCMCIDRQNKKAAYNTIYDTVHKFVGTPSVSVNWIE